ncbi:uncharacterized protein LOC123703306 isoform X2 [Colias croceus]|uniref:uncharacterized protein LOC123703306 isoform X2 n=1 Tax=Colias crocea TaxID=72248 RepID=UPI001E27CB46|nr:uncharacterized protein LOC123703306 isoform X2 [Colias croceus]
MKFLLFLILARYAVRCDDESNYYVIEMPEDVPRDKKPFRVYWNVPTMQCKSKKIPFDNLHDKYGIIQNKDDSFLGEKIAILYDPGLFPALFKNESSGKFKFRNGGVPQEGALELHLDAFKNAVSQSIPDPDFNGVAIIDFESWRPVFRQNFGVLVPYKDVSYEIEKKVHWWWPKSWITAEAKQRFEEAGRRFMQNTISTAKQLRPKAIWGYYGFPYCFNKASTGIDSCPTQVVNENDETYWLWAESTALYPSVYSSQDLSSSELAALIQGRMKEASRLKRRGTPILPYFWYRYQDGGFLREVDLSIALQSLYKSNASGVIIWGSSHDVNTIEKCNKLKRYVETTLGPHIAKYTKDTHKIKDEYIPEPTDIWDLKPNIDKTKNTTQTQTDPEYNWIPPENYTHEIIKNVEQELMKKGYEELNKTKVNESLIFDMLSNIRTTDEIEKEIAKNDKNNIKMEVISQVVDTTTELVSTLDNYTTSTTQQTTESVKTTQQTTESIETTQYTTEPIKSTTNYSQVQFSTTETLQIDSTTSQEFNNYEQFENDKFENHRIINKEQFDSDKKDAEQSEIDKTENKRFDDHKINDEQFESQIANDELFENHKLNDEQIYNHKINDEQFENDKINDEFFVLSTNISQIDITTEDSISSKKPRSVNLEIKTETTTEYFEEFVDNSTFHLLTPDASDEDGDFSKAAISSNNFVYTFTICVISMYV